LHIRDDSSFSVKVIVPLVASVFALCGIMTLLYRVHKYASPLLG
jgi:hypothetical protein